MKRCLTKLEIAETVKCKYCDEPATVFAPIKGDAIPVSSPYQFMCDKHENQHGKGSQTMLHGLELLQPDNQDVGTRKDFLEKSYNILTWFTQPAHVMELTAAQLIDKYQHESIEKLIVAIKQELEQTP